jgi:D-glycero-alpha-D-manno-heptose-7-phosphate kinase
MIVSKTPFRMSFVGGGSDLKAYYCRGYGAVVSTTINKYMYVALNKRFDDTIRVSYTKTEIVDSVEKIKHELVREAMIHANLTKGIEITTIADIPAGTGLGSSSSLTVGLLNALNHFCGRPNSVQHLAEESCKIEIDILKKPIGKQDQYSAAYGDLNYIQFDSDGAVQVEPIHLLKNTREELNNNLLAFYTGLRGDNTNILSKQKQATESKKNKREILDRMVNLAQKMKDILNSNDITSFGELLHKNWLLKRSITIDISNKFIDSLYKAGLSAGALGGKILGAGGGGFILFYCDEERQNRLRKAMLRQFNLKEFKFNLESQGSRIIYAEK